MATPPIKWDYDPAFIEQLRTAYMGRIVDSQGIFDETGVEVKFKMPRLATNEDVRQGDLVHVDPATGKLKKAVSHGGRGSAKPVNLTIYIDEAKFFTDEAARRIAQAMRVPDHQLHAYRCAVEPTFPHLEDGVVCEDMPLYSTTSGTKIGMAKVSVSIQDGDHLLRVNGVEVEPEEFKAYIHETYEEFYLRHIDGPSAVEDFPRKCEHIDDLGDLAYSIGLFYDETGEEVPNVFAYDLDEGYCWQNLFNEDGTKAMDGSQQKCRRVTGNFTVKRAS